MPRPRKQVSETPQALKQELQRLQRELEVEAALEKVRNRAMAMRTSAEQAETSAVMFHEIKDLGINAIRTGVAIIDEPHEAIELWLTTISEKGKVVQILDYVNIHVHPVYENILPARKKKKPYALTVLEGAEVKDYYQKMSTYLTLPKQKKYNEKEHFYSFFFTEGSINVIVAEPLSKEECSILSRFANAFGLIYTRFIDLQKAEKQAQEARIEASLERVRTRSMAMRKTEELSEVAVLLYHELRVLGVTNFFNCGYVEVDAEHTIQHGWMTGQRGNLLEGFILPLTGDAVLQERYEAWQRQDPVFYQSVGGDELWKHIAFVSPHFGSKEVDQMVKTNFADPTVFYCFNFANGYLHIINNALLNVEDEELTIRFARVFELTYRRFLDLKKAEAQAREAQIEAALETVRSRAMAMQRSEELQEVILVVMSQFHLLGFNVDLANFNFPSRSRDWTMWVARPDYAYPEQIRLPYFDHVLFNGPREAVKKGLDFLSDLLSREEGEIAMQHFLTHSIVGSDPPEVKERIKDAKGLARSMVFGKHIALTISNYEGIPYTSEQNTILRRFHGVFEQSYTRFLDLQKAEAQAREAQIELSLERIRARTMAMHKSNELAETVSLLFKQLLSLGIQSTQIRTCGIVTFKDTEPVGETWITETTGEIHENSTLIRFDEAPAYKAIYSGWKAGEKFRVVSLAGAALLEHVNFLKKYQLPMNDEVAKQNRATEIHIHALFFSSGYLFIISYEPLPSFYTLFKRFGTVFEQSYTRFLDLQKAEAQTREAQIEVAVERVRAKALAMHRSEEILGVAVSVRDAMVGLDLPGVSAATIYLKQDSGSIRIWDITELLESEEGPYLSLDFEFRLEETDPDLWLHKILNSTEKYSVVEMDKDDLLRSEVWLRGFDPKNADNFVRFMESAQLTHLWLPVVPLANGTLNVDFVQPPPAEMEFILPKMGAAFDLAYKRFLDLQKAEGQVREAQIETALERVRSRTMGMQKSEELREVIQVIYEQLVQLGVNAVAAGFYMDIQESNDWNLWVADAGYTFRNKVHIPFFDHPIFHRYVEAKEKGLDLYAYNESYHYEEKDKILEHWVEHVTETPAELEELGLRSPAWTLSSVLMNDVGLYVHNFSLTPLSDADNAILIRFTKVFVQTYTRFKDLEKAEAQTRQAQIEAAIEKVRARSLAMQKPEELVEVAALLRKEMGSLGVEELETSSIYILGENDATECWFAIRDLHDAKKFVNDHMTIDLHATWVGRQMLQFYQSGQKQTSIVMRGEDRKEWINYFVQRSKELQQYYEDGIPERTYHLLKFSNGFMGAASPGEISTESWELLQRATSVFSFAYTRFSDLQQAEAQAREAKIELALERVRARTMAMHKSDELAEIVSLLFKQLEVLNFGLDQVLIAIIDKNNNAIAWWSRGFGIDIIPKCYLIPIVDHPFLNQWLATWENGSEYSVYNLAGEIKKTWDEYLFTQTDLKDFPPEVQQAMRSQESFYLCDAFIKQGSIQAAGPAPLTDDQAQILKRFATVLNQTYTRLIDLQRAEAQAREAQIELALERIRAKTMAMQKSDELRDVIQVVFQQFQELSFKIDAAYFNVDYKESDDLHAWIASTARTYPNRIDIPYFDNEFFKIFKEGREKELDLITSTIALEEKNRFWKHFFKHATVVPERQAFILSAPGLATSNALMSHVTLCIANYQGVPFSDAENAILKRVGKVFEQAYTRFRDLEKAEVQAHEAQIEASLERVRSSMMAMHQSDGLPEVMKVAAEQFLFLGVRLDSVLFFPAQEGKGLNFWSATTERTYPLLIHVPYVDNPLIKGVRKAIHDELDFSTITLSYEEAQHWWRHLLDKSNVGPLFSDQRRNYVLSTKALTTSVASRKNSTLSVVNYSGFLFSEEENAILMRFANVFEQAYTRFLDIQKAEAQTREAQIEAALERVRSSMMAMHQSDGLPEVMKVISDQLIHLGVRIDSVTFIPTRIDKDFKFWSAIPDESYPILIHVPYFDHPIFNLNIKAFEGGDDFLSYILTKEETRRWWEHIFDSSNVSHLISDSRKEYVLNSKGYSAAFAIRKNSTLGIANYSALSFSDEENSILKRFANVFEQAYTRFLDIEKAEAQTHEAQIEASLERVRSKTMAMHDSHDVGESVATLFEELVKLGITTNRCGILIHDDHAVAQVWTAKSNPGEKANLIIGRLEINMHPMLKAARTSWMNKESFFSFTLEGEDLKRYYLAINDLPTYPTRFNIDALPAKEVHSAFHFAEGSLFAFTGEPIPTDSVYIFERFTNVFGQTYRRYLDLQKAEAQVREAQIEASLERVRSRMMAMHHSEDLPEVMKVITEQFTHLGFNIDAASFRPEIAKTDYQLWISTPHKAFPEETFIPYFDHPIFKLISEAVSNKADSLVLNVSGEDTRSWWSHFLEKANVRHLSDQGRKLVLSISVMSISMAIMKYTLLSIWNYSGKPFSDEENAILKRFAKVFEQTYARFLELKKAEAQAREATIEAALEKVRGKAMAMHTSEDLATTMYSFYNELMSLFKTPIIRCGAALLNRDNRMAELTTVSRTKQGELVDVSGTIDTREHPLLINTYTNWLIQKEYRHVLRGNEIKAYYEYMTKQIGLPDYSADAVQYFYIPMFTEGSFYIITETELAQEEVQVYNRFVSVLNLTYKRYNDIRKAEAQAREAQIEAALEKVRSSALAMQKPMDMLDLCRVISDQLKLLNVKDLRNVQTLVINAGKYEYVNYQYFTIYGKTSVEVIDYRLHPVELALAEQMLASPEAFYEKTFEGDELQQWRDHRRKTNQLPDPKLDEASSAYYYFFSIGAGALGVTAFSALDERALATFKRFRNVFELAYRRYIDIEQAISQAKEAIRRSSIDRVRAEIASMRSTNDLNRITPLIWSELTTLGVPFVRCGVHIIDEEKELLYNYLNTPDGKAISTADGELIAFFQLPFETSGFFARLLSRWKEKKIYLEHLDKSGFAEIATTLVKHGVFATEEQYLSTLTHTDLDGHFLPFLQGMLYVANTAPLDADQLELLQSLADAFSTAYARYEDFNKLESAKAQIEKTLVDLKLTQTQLVQSEKMASLGELTAGIAHEIQNPLNFVNNFSEVSKELLDEMKAELASGNSQPATELAETVIQNLEKINFHGKRADAIVKGMLQHSRTSSGQKELTDLNVLCDEYLRLSYHGLRAKDKSFNAKFESDFDPQIEKVLVVPQDIGRVILNLINNAFYAVTEKRKLNLKDYEPTVTVSTRRDNGMVAISVKDNGVGIPQKALDKIFQPFFTTKPTGQGTGLGLSLSYDIVKAHGGELRVETKEGKGSEFVIVLPV